MFSAPPIVIVAFESIETLPVVVDVLIAALVVIPPVVTKLMLSFPDT